MEPQSKNDARRLILALALLALMVAGVIALATSGRLWTLSALAWEIFQGKDQMRAYVESWGSMAPAAFIFIQAFQVVFAPIPGEATGAVGGFVFGALPNVAYSTAGLTLGSIMAFTLARIIGLPLVKLVVSAEDLDKFHFLMERSGIVLAFLLFLIPGFPKDILSYLLGLSPMKFTPFIAVCAIGRIPGTVMLSFFGSAFYEENWSLVIAVSVVCLIALAFFFVYRERIEARLKRIG
jgi:uncharacterized membrane protein YdjX (TVP38/TMEM64 family)